MKLCSSHGRESESCIECWIAANNKLAAFVSRTAWERNELLEACKFVRAHEGEHSEESREQIRLRLDAAIAKAEGDGVVPEGRER